MDAFQIFMNKNNNEVKSIINKKEIFRGIKLIYSISNDEIDNCSVDEYNFMLKLLREQIIIDHIHYNVNIRNKFIKSEIFLIHYKYLLKSIQICQKLEKKSIDVPTNLSYTGKVLVSHLLFNKLFMPAMEPYTQFCIVFDHIKNREF
jgi:hypothetical protein